MSLPSLLGSIYYACGWIALCTGLAIMPVNILFDIFTDIQIKYAPLQALAYIVGSAILFYMAAWALLPYTEVNEKPTPVNQPVERPE